jgi:ATP-dependent RNA helicase RhlE
VHRIGRTGRAGASGHATSLVSREERSLLRDIERLLKREIPRELVGDFVASRPATSFRHGAGNSGEIRAHQNVPAKKFRAETGRKLPGIGRSPR